MARPDERRFITFRRGHVRDNIILSRFRSNLRGKLNPDTGQVFTEDEIAIILQPDSRFWTEADGIDLFGQAVQSRALWFSDQVRPERAATPFLNDYHGDLWIPEGKLPASGGSGPVTATGSVGTIFVGSTILGDATAVKARDPNGKRYQVLVTSVIGAGGTATLQLQAIDGGDDTNPVAGTVLTWINPPVGSDPQASVAEDFSGGFNEETDAEYADRIEDRIQFKPGAGNGAQFRAWARQASNAVETAFVFCTALHAGNVIVCVTQKRGTTKGSLARIPSIGTLATVTGYLVPPISPVVPHGKHVLVVPPTSEPQSMVLKLAMRKGSSAGWTDVTPWPEHSATYNEGVKVIGTGGGAPADPTQTVFYVETDVALAGAPLTSPDAPSLMIWGTADDDSRFEELDVQEVALQAGDIWKITLSTGPTKTIAIGDVISPNNERALVIAQSVEAYFDELGAGEVLASTDVRFARAARFPRPDVDRPTGVGQGVIARLDDQLGGAMSNAELMYPTSQVSPSLPTEIADGPKMLTLDELGVYAL